MTEYVDPAPYEKPKDEREQQEAMRAIYLERQRTDGDKLIESLTDREREILEAAWHAGANEARSDIQERLRNPHALTLDARAVANVIGVAGRRLDLRLRWRMPGAHYDDRAVNLVRSVDHVLRQAQDVGQ